MSNRLGLFLAHFYSSPSPRSTSPSNAVTASNPKISSATQYILNDTSLAALTLPSGDRQLFFQDNNGYIRRAVRTASDGQWAISPGFNLSINSKTHTPLAATVYNSAEAGDAGYIDDSSTMVGIQEMYARHSR